MSSAAGVTTLLCTFMVFLTMLTLLLASSIRVVQEGELPPPQGGGFLVPRAGNPTLPRR